VPVEQRELPPPYPDDDEINLAELAAAVWQIRGLIVGGALLAVAIAIGVLAVQQFSDLRRDSVSGYIELTAITDGAYPSGARFSPADVTGGEVLGDLRSRLDLPAELALADALTVEYGHPAAASLREERDIAIAAAREDDAAVSDITALRNNYEAQISNLARGGLHIRLNLTDLGIDVETGQAIVEMLPASWQRVYGERYRILLPPAVTRLGSISEDQSFTDGDGPLAAEQYLREARLTLETIAEDARLAMVTAPNGDSTSELLYQLSQFRQLYFDPYLATQVSDQDNALGQLFIRDLEAQRRELQALLSETSRTIETVANMRSGGIPADQQQRLERGSGESRPTLSLSDDGLSSIVDLAQQSGMQEYLTQLFERRYELTQQIARIDTRIEKFTDDAQLERISMTGLDEAIATRFQSLQAAVNGLVDNAHERARQRTAKLYEFLAQPTVPSPIPEPSRAGMIIALAAILGGMLGLFGGLLMRAVQSQRSD